GQPLFVVGNTVLQPTLLLKVAQRFQPTRESLTANLLEVAVKGKASRDIEMREMIADLLQPHSATLGNGQGPREHIRCVLEDAVHLVMALDVKAGALELHSVRFLDGLAGLNAK